MVTTVLLAGLGWFGCGTSPCASGETSIESRLDVLEKDLSTLKKCIVVSQARMCSVCGDMRHALQNQGGPYEAPDHCGVCGNHGYKHVLMLNEECESILQEAGLARTTFDYQIISYETRPPLILDDETYCKSREALGFFSRVEPYLLTNATCKTLYKD